MILENALIQLKNKWNTKDILEILWIKFSNDYFNHNYYNEKLDLLPKWDYFISDLDWTFFRWTLQKEAVTLFIKFVRKQDYLDLDFDKYQCFLKDVKFFNDLEKQAYNKEIEYFEYLNAGIYLLLRHRELIDWEDYLMFIKNSFKSKEQINPFRFSINKMKEVLENGNNFIFVSWAPNFIFEIYINLLKKYITKNLWEKYAQNVYWFWSFLYIDKLEYVPLWWKDNKNDFINLLKNKWIIINSVWWMWDTCSDFWISYSLNKNKDFYFVNPEKKVIDQFDELFIKGINYHMIIERKNLIIEIKKEDIKFI